MADRLRDATSPYLLQHAGNPVDWWPWCEEAFQEAARRDVPVMLSVGYSACHWCHVMAHESFEDEQTAAIMNEHLVAVKVDREERPDVDAIYMTATQAMTGQGGWPMTVFMTPGREPFYCGTYLPAGAFPAPGARGSQGLARGPGRRGGPGAGDRRGAGRPVGRGREPDGAGYRRRARGRCRAARGGLRCGGGHAGWRVRRRPGRLRRRAEVPAVHGLRVPAAAQRASRPRGRRPCSGDGRCNGVRHGQGRHV